MGFWGVTVVALSAGDLDGLESVGALGGGVDWADEVAGLALCAFGAIPAAELKDWVFGPLDDEEDEDDDE